MNPSWRRNYQRYKAYLLHTVEEYRSRKDVRLYLELFLSLITIVLFASFALRPTLLTIVDLFKQIDSKKETIEIMDEKLANLNTARELYNSQENSIKLLQEAVPDQSSPQQIIRQLEGLKSKHDFRLVNVSIGEADLLGNSQRIEEDQGVAYSMNTQADYENLYRIIKDVEQTRRPNVIESISFARSTLDDSLILVLNANVVYLNNFQNKPER
ncbi:hypothetical protein ACFL2C_01665 [Patescibacteria group bacterium]